jgi:hypothetical protein
MAEESQFKKATRELIGAVQEAAKFHDEAMRYNDTETNKRYQELSKRVKSAETLWRELFKPGAST